MFGKELRNDRFKDRLFLYFDNNKHRETIKNILLLWRTRMMPPIERVKNVREIWLSESFCAFDNRFDAWNVNDVGRMKSKGNDIEFTKLQQREKNKT